jgi:hypothetical protein
MHFLVRKGSRSFSKLTAAWAAVALRQAMIKNAGRHTEVDMELVGVIKEKHGGARLPPK